MLREAAELAEGENEDDDGNNEENRLAGDQQQNCRAEDSGHYQINQNRQSKIHSGIITIFPLYARA